ncbi:MAG TPA: hypothetical protein VGN90_11010 [Pyrinomonadaceae bacterium]|nr:hypothetical protein [Pyrinomonadaceae bacterium]
MLTSLYNKEHAARRPSGIIMPGVVGWGCSGLPALDTFDSKLVQVATTPINSRRIRH